MSHFMKSVTAVVLLLMVNTANAGIINFINLTQAAGGYGEGAWTSLNLSSDGVNVSITGHATNDNDPTQYAYLDWGNAGLGACKDVLSTALVNTMSSGNTANNCAPSSDDNVTSKEFLSFVFDKKVVITNIWFNNNHDGGLGSGDNVKIDDKVFKLTTGYAGDANGIGSFSVNAWDSFDVKYLNEEFYISAIEFSAVPESGSLALLCIGVLAVWGVRKVRHN